MPLRPMANRFGGCFCLGSGPVFGFCCVFCCLLRCFRWRNASLAGGFGGSSFVFFVWLWFSVLLLQSICRFQGPFVLYSVFPAYSHVRTDPLARHRPHSRKKKRLKLGNIVRLYLYCFFLKEKGGHMGDPWLACRTVQCKLHGLSPPGFLVGGSRLERCQSTSRYGTCCCYAQSSR